MFLSSDTEFKVIDEFRSGRWTDSQHKMEYFFIFLVLKKMGISIKDPVSNIDFRAGSRKRRKVIFEALQMTTALFDPSEKPGKFCSVDVFAFDNSNTPDYKYFNGGTVWEKLPGRIPDTIDNTLRDYFLNREVAKDGARFFTLRQNYLDILTGPSFLDGRKINVYLLASWLYRFYEFEDVENISPLSFLTYLRDLFYKDFNINEKESKRLFKEDIIDVSFSDDHISGKRIRDRLPEIKSEIYHEKLPSFPAKPKFNYTDYKYNRGKISMNEDEIYSVLKKHRQVILFGPPGTGKSYVAKKVSEMERDGKRIFKERNVLTIQFHPSYRYEDFIGGVRWDPKDNKPTIVEGQLLSLCKEACKNPSEEFLLIIDEINRGKISNIFGEAIMTLDRDFKVKISEGFFTKELAVTEDGLFFIPKNLYILGTMNSTDRSLALIDYALRRRFHFIRTDFDKIKLEEYYSKNGRSPEIEHHGNTFNVIEFATKLNERIEEVLGREMTLGQSYFMAESGTWDITEFMRQFNYLLLPMLEEYTFGKAEKLSEILRGLNKRFTDEEEFYAAIQEYLTS